MKNIQKGGRKWSVKYKKSINCNRPKGFSQKQYCKFINNYLYFFEYLVLLFYSLLLEIIK